MKKKSTSYEKISGSLSKAIFLPFLLMLIFLSTANAQENIVKRGDISGVGSYTKGLPFGNLQNGVVSTIPPKQDGEAQTTQIPMANLGIEADKKVEKHLPFMEDNAAVIECPLQAMRGNVSTNGLVIKSLSKEEGAGDFILRPLSYSKGEQINVGNGLISIETNAVLLNRGNLTERFTASTDGIRQDFILANAPVGTQDLSVMLELKGAVATNSAQGVSIKMDNGRKLEYHNLYITDAAGKVIKGEMKAVSEGLIAINVNDANAVYPLTIDPTITDADWVALNTSIPGTNDVINAIAISGTDIYVGGAFIAAGSGLANYIAKWNGSAWSALGSGVSGTVYSLAISGTDLYVGGYFATAGGITVNNIAKWDITTSTWSALGSGVSSDVKALAISGTDVYAGGVFTTAGGNPANYIAKWNGTAWSALGVGLNLRVLCIAISGSDVYAGGRFTTAGGSSANRIAKWNITTSTWSALGSGANNYVLAIAINGTDLYAGGTFTSAGGNSADRIAKWNITTSAWSALGSGLSGMSNEARAIAISGSDVYVGGSFDNAGGVTVGRIAKWNGASWSALGSGLNDNPQAIAISGSGDLYVGGHFTTAGDVAASKFAKWNGTAWSVFGSGLNASVIAIAINGGDMYIGGGLLQVGNVPASKIAKWNGSVWSALGTGIELTNGRGVSAIAISGGDVYVGGGFTTAGGITVNNIAKWDGTAWSALGSGVGNSVSSIAISGTDVYAGGYFTTAGGVSANQIAKWNGTAWSALGTGLNSSVAAIAINGSNVYAGGQFTTAGGNPANYIAKWDGTSWSALGSGLGAQVMSIAISGSNVYAAGAFTTAGGVAANYIAKWDETTATWTALGSGVNSYIYTIATSGNDVYVGGSFTTAGGVSANRIAKWDGTAWSALGSGVNASPGALAMSGTTELIVGGGFMTAGDKFSPYLAKVVLPPPPTIISFTPTSAGTGTTVTITGTNFTGATAVSFGGTAAASFSVVSATSITAVVATGTTGTLSVTTSGGTATSSSTFTYISCALPSVDSQSTTTQTQCLNGTFSSISVAATGTGLSYQWYSNAIASTSGGSIIGTNATSYTPLATTAGTLYYYCVVTGTCGTATSAVSGAFITNALPTIGISVTPSASICNGTSVTLSGTGGLAYSWNGGVINASAFTPVSTLTYTVTGEGSNGCTNTATQTITVNPLPTVNAGADITICPGTSTSLTAIGAVSYSWTGGVVNGTSFTPSATTTYVVTGTNAYNCSNTDTVVVNIRDLSIGSITPVICKGVADTLTAPSGSNYKWKKNGAIMSGKTTRSIYVTVVGSYSVTYQDSMCGLKTLPAIALTLQTPPAKPLLYASKAAICPGDSTTLFTNVVATKYIWFFGNNTSVLTGASSINYHTTAIGTYYVKALDSFGCRSIVSGAKVIKASLVPVPVVTIVNATQGAKKLACTNAGTYQWRLNGNNIAGATAKAFIATQSGAYSIRLTSNSGCTAISSDTTLTINYTGPKMSQEELAVISTAEDINVYPNPSNGIIYIDAKETLKAVIIDLQGRTILESNHVSQLDITGYSNGIYLLQLFNEDGEMVKVTKLIKE